MIQSSHHSRELSGGVPGERLVVTVASHLVLEFRKLLAEGGGILFRHVHGGVRDSDRKEAEEWTLVVIVDPLHGPIHDEIVSVGFSVEFDFLEIVEEPGWVVGMGIALAIIAEEAVETLIDGISFRARIAQAPLSEGPGGITGLLESFRDG